MWADYCELYPLIWDQVLLSIAIHNTQLLEKVSVYNLQAVIQKRLNSVGKRDCRTASRASLTLNTLRLFVKIWHHDVLKARINGRLTKFHFRICQLRFCKSLRASTLNQFRQRRLSKKMRNFIDLCASVARFNRISDRIPQVKIVKRNGIHYALFATDDLISKHIMKHGEWSKKERQICEEYILDINEGIVIDAGANLGGFSMPLAKKYESTSIDFHCIEAQRLVANQITTNAFLNSLYNVYVHHCALGDSLCEIEIPVSDFMNSLNLGAFTVDVEIREKLEIEASIGKTTPSITLQEKTENVQCVPLDSIHFSKQVKFIKLDIEGSELSFLNGASYTLQHHEFPPILFESWNDKFRWFRTLHRDLMQKFSESGYDVNSVDGREYIATRSP